MPKKFIVYIDNHALSFLNRQEKLNHRHVKWMEYLQSYTFKIKHKKGVENKVSDALSRRNLTIQEIRLENVGFNSIKDLYEQDEDFKEVYQVCTDMTGQYHSTYADYMLQEGLLFKEGQLCIPRGSLRENIIKEKHCGSLAGHFGLDKTLELVRRFYYWPRMTIEV